MSHRSHRSRRRGSAVLAVIAVPAAGVVAGMFTAVPSYANTDSGGGSTRAIDGSGGSTRAVDGGKDRATRRGNDGSASRTAPRRVTAGRHPREPDHSPECHKWWWPYVVPLPTQAVNVNPGILFPAVAGLGAPPRLPPPAVVSASGAPSITGALPESPQSAAGSAPVTLTGSIAPQQVPSGGPFIPVPPPAPPPAPPPPPQAAPPPPRPAAAPPVDPPSRLGYPDYLRAASVAEVAALALSGLAGLAALTGLGGLVGYRQAKAGFAMPPSGVGRFLP